MVDLKLVPFSIENAEQVLSWRNSERVRTNMIDDTIIDLKQHSAFLRKLEGDSSRKYFVVELRGESVAAIYFSDLDSAEITWGCYVGVEKVIPGLFVALVAVAVKFAFSYPNTLALKSEVALHNQSPIKMNRFLGIQSCARCLRATKSGQKIEFLTYKLTLDSFDSVLQKARSILPSSLKKLCNKTWTG